MAKKAQYNSLVNGIIPYAKKSGVTSFSSLWSIKHALHTGKVGHTGTLDSFADGLLVVLSGHLTHLVPHITGFDKTYRAVVCFGRETNTLDPTGTLVQTGSAVEKERIEAALLQFTGALLQVPPVYSAVHVNGKRASDAARSGEAITLEPREVFVYKNQLIEYRAPTKEDAASYALLEITCSKGTYIRALARDIAKALGTCAHLVALRRIRVGPFLLEDAALQEELAPFGIEYALSALQNPPAAQKDTEAVFESIRRHCLPFTPSLAVFCGLEPVTIARSFESAYNNGRPLKKHYFSKQFFYKKNAYTVKNEYAAFYANGDFAGIVQKNEGRLQYGFVSPKKAGIRVFSWKDVQEKTFPQEWITAGTALSVGSFDGMHQGHKALLETLVAQPLISGIVTFTAPPKSLKQQFGGTLTPLSQRLLCAEKNGITFAIVIDFSEDFSKIEGEHFIRTLVSHCGLRYLAEGADFRCGYKGGITMQNLPALAKTLGFTLHCVPNVLYQNERVSSSRIREAILQADFSQAACLLGYNYGFMLSAFVWQKEADSPESKWFFTKPTGVLLPRKKGFYCVTVTVHIEGEPLEQKKRAVAFIDTPEYMALWLDTAPFFCARDVVFEKDAKPLRLTEAARLVGESISILPQYCKMET